MIIRAAEVGDAGAIAAIWNPYIRDTAATFTTTEKTTEGLAADITARQAGGGAFTLAEADGQVIGFATYFPFRAGPGYARTMEHSVILGPGARGRGIGRALMQALEARAREEGVHVLVAGVSGENATAVAFHEALGFERVGQMPEVGHKFGRWMDLVLLQKVL